MCSNSVFSDFKVNSGAGNNTSTARTNKNSNNSKELKELKVVNPQSQLQAKEIKNDKTDNIKQAAPYVIPLASIPAAAFITHKYSTKNMSNLQNEIKNLSGELNKLKEETKKIVENAKKNQIPEKNIQTANTNDVNLWGALLAIVGAGVGYNAHKMSTPASEQQKDNVIIHETRVENNQNSNLINKYLEDVNGVKLLNSPALSNRNRNKYKQAIEIIKNAAPNRLYNEPAIVPITSAHPVLWSVTSEFAPIKDGGLGSVPVAIQDNITKLGVDNPNFIPMYLQKGKATLKSDNNSVIYQYGDKEFQCKKAASFDMDVFRNGETKTENVEIYVANLETDDKKPSRQLVFIKNNNYFDGAIYQTGAKSEEAEKFAFFSKAVYEFAKMKADITSVKNPQITDTEQYNSIKEADGLILNDWQSSPVAALARYKAPMENAHGELNDSAAKKLADMKIITIGHNAKYQGSAWLGNTTPQATKEVSSNILNTLFDNYTFDIVSNATTGAVERNPEDKGLENLDNVLLIDKNNPNEIHTNLLNMGVCLSDYFCPVSKNYANELLQEEHSDLSGELRWALTQRDGSKSLKGIINGNDFNENSIERKKGFIKATSGLDYETYNKQTDINTVMEARKHNKLNFYNEFMKPFSKTADSSNKDAQVEKVRGLTNNGKRKLEFVNSENIAKVLPDIDENTPVISSVGRLVSQKGINVMCSAIAILMNNWEQDFPGKPKPIFYIGGSDGEGGKQRKFVENLQNCEVIDKEKDNNLKLENQEDSNRIIFGHGFAPTPTFAAASDFFLLPSIFEPCGLTQSEAFALGTPVIASSVGGIVDTVNRDKNKQNGVLTDVEKELSSQKLYEALKKGLNIYFNNPEKYKEMVNNSLQEDFSWIQPNNHGPIYEYLDLLGIKANS